MLLYLAVSARKVGLCLMDIIENVGYGSTRTTIKFFSKYLCFELIFPYTDRNGFESLERSAINRGNHVPSKQPPTSLTLPRMASRSAKDGISQVLPIEEMLFANSNNASAETLQVYLPFTNHVFSSFFACILLFTFK